MATSTVIDLDDLVEHWTVLDDERTLVAGKRGGRGVARIWNTHPPVSKRIDAIEHRLAGTQTASGGVPHVFAGDA